MEPALSLNLSIDEFKKLQEYLVNTGMEGEECPDVVHEILVMDPAAVALSL